MTTIESKCPYTENFCEEPDGDKSSWKTKQRCLEHWRECFRYKELNKHLNKYLEDNNIELYAKILPEEVRRGGE